jgi:hypothetical protein
MQNEPFPPPSPSPSPLTLSLCSPTACGPPQLSANPSFSVWQAEGAHYGLHQLLDRGQCTISGQVRHLSAGHRVVLHLRRASERDCHIDIRVIPANVGWSAVRIITPEPLIAISSVACYSLRPISGRPSALCEHPPRPLADHNHHAQLQIIVAVHSPYASSMLWQRPVSMQRSKSPPQLQCTLQPPHQVRPR